MVEPLMGLGRVIYNLFSLLRFIFGKSAVLTANECLRAGLGHPWFELGLLYIYKNTS